MQGLKVQCPNCKKIMFKTTKNFNPLITPRGNHVESLARYHIDWLCTSSTLAAEMTCPECLAQLAPKGILHVLVPARECGQFFKDNSWKQCYQSYV